MGKNSSIFIHSVSAPKPHETEVGSDGGNGMWGKWMRSMHERGNCYVGQGGNKLFKWYTFFYCIFSPSSACQDDWSRVLPIPIPPRNHY